MKTLFLRSKIERWTFQKFILTYWNFFVPHVTSPGKCSEATVMSATDIS